MMAKKAAKRREWLKADLQQLKALARDKTPARVIGRKLGRSEGAIRQKGWAEGISLNTRARRKARAK
jgi:hypothetical protein